jgi:hypothetical protein
LAKEIVIAQQMIRSQIFRQPDVAQEMRRAMPKRGRPFPVARLEQPSAQPA